MTVSELEQLQSATGLDEIAVQRLHKRFQMLDIDGMGTIDEAEIDMMAADKEQKRMILPLFHKMFTKKDGTGIDMEDFLKVFSEFRADKTTDHKLRVFFDFISRCPGGVERVVTRESLVEFFQEYAPDKMSNIDVILQRFNTDQIVENLVKKYKAEPTVTEGVTLPQVQYLANACMRHQIKDTDPETINQLLDRSFKEFDKEQNGYITLQRFCEGVREIVPEAELASLLTVDMVNLHNR